MKMNNVIVAALIGASGAIIAAVIGVSLSSSQTEQLQQPTPTPASKSGFSPLPLSADFYPSGWMGDGEKGEKYLTADPAIAEIDGKTKAAICFSYSQGNKGWAGVYWQHPENNWGRNPGFNLNGAREIVFYARGANGGEIVEFISGGIQGGKYSDSYRVSTGQIQLEKEWASYNISLTNYNLTSVIGAFAWSAPGKRDTSLKFCVADVEIR